MSKIRLSDQDLDALRGKFQQHFLDEDRLWLFGSRVDLTKKGGDIDLYIETHAKTIADAVKMESDFIWDLEQEIGEQKIDVVLNVLSLSSSLPIYDIAKTKGVRVV